MNNIRKPVYSYCDRMRKIQVQIDLKEHKDV